MRPVLLTMKAFGSYAGYTEVDFDRLTGGLYLIVGKTGAGKTTVFDAISFALFGRPSGSERTAEMLHSDFVSKGEDTVVTLDFLHQGRKYRVERTLHFPRKRGAAEYGDVQISAVMTGEGLTPLEGATRVTARCEELLGLNAEQFRRIVMLAQGEFREFLRAGSDKKNEILGRLFDNTEYLRFQNLLGSVRDSLRKQRAQRETQVRTVMETSFRLPEGERGEDYLPGHPHLAENLTALAERESAGLMELRQEKERSGALVEELKHREGEAQAVNAALAELQRQRSRLESLNGQETAMEARQRTYLSAEKALHRVKPGTEAVDRADRDLRKTREDLQAQRLLYEKQLGERDAAQKAAEGDGALRERTETLTAEIGRIQGALPRYRDLRESIAALEEARSALGKVREHTGVLTHRQEAMEQELGNIRVELAALEGCEAESVRLEGERDAALERRNALTDPDTGILPRWDAIRREEAALARDRETLAALTEEARMAEEERHGLYTAFLTGQAGLIAVDMERELAEQGETVCKVCNTPFHRGQAHHFALPADRVPEKAQVEAAEKRAKAAEQKRQKKQSDLERNAGLLEQRKEGLAGETRRLDPACGGWDTLEIPEYLTGLAQRLETAFVSREEAYGESRRKCSRRQKLLEEQETRTADLGTLEKELREQTARGEDLEKRILSLETGQSELRKQLPFPEEEAAHAQLKASMAERTRLQEEMEAHTRMLRSAQAEADRTAGSIRTLEEGLPGKQQTLDAAEQALTLTLEETGFRDRDAAEAALEPVIGDGEAWLTAEKKALDDYARDREAARARIGELEEQTAGRKAVDMGALREELDHARKIREAVEAREREQSSLLEGHRSVLETVRKAREALAVTDGAIRRMEVLADTALGATGEGGKLSFDRYVMGSLFREVLEMANRRLNVMTGGRFELIHTLEAGRKNAQAGLEIQVLDVALGKQRPSGSISGGEGFMVSLALALGLSDVVQNHAGGRKLDTLFIDEGFGTLDDGKLDNVITVLQQLTEGSRLVGIISHVDKLEESIPQKLRVTGGEKGSTLTLELR